jgi:hypothetical protein
MDAQATDWSTVHCHPRENPRSRATKIRPGRRIPAMQLSFRGRVNLKGLP